ncbi:Rrf2 family transcriptional regulator [Telmatobacter bradus]|uniref:Rrf2 family transcriptional regulator n=1 Tax=Telmatobacter bradus TaxID=474953 RepID=UPI003B43D2DD
MNISTRFTVALHILTLLASQPGEALTSEYIAGSVNTNAVFVRRLMGVLRNVGLVASQPGQRGGWELAADPENISLADVRKAIEEGSPFSMHSQPPNPLCPVGRNIQGSLGTIYEKAERALENELARTTIKGLLRSVQARERT